MEYFAYGSNMNVPQMAHRCPDANNGRVARLADHRFVINSRGVATIVPDALHTVIGVLWSVGHKEIEILDEYEGVAANRYIRTQVSLSLDGGGLAMVDEAIVYIATDATPGPPRPGYLETILDGAQYFGLPTDYIRKLGEWTNQ